jgi:hypothetical protein
MEFSVGTGSQIQNVGPNSFQMIILLGKIGNYSIRVNNPDGTASSTQEQVFPNRTIGSLTGSQIVLNPDFTTAAHTWSVEVLNSGGGFSGELIVK